MNQRNQPSFLQFMCRHLITTTRKVTNLVLRKILIHKAVCVHGLHMCMKMKRSQIRLLAYAVSYTSLFFNKRHTLQIIFTPTYVHQHLSFESCVLLMDTQTTTATGEHTSRFYLMIQLIAFYSKHSELRVCCHMHREGSNRQLDRLATAAFFFIDTTFFPSHGVLPITSHARRCFLLGPS